MNNSYIIYEGPSRILGNIDIVMIATGFKTKSRNRKTGNVIQTYIFCQEQHPYEAWQNGIDEAVCGDCPHRGKESGKRSCYVNLTQSLSKVWQAYKNGSYEYLPLSEMDIFHDKIVRAGAFGEPTAVPLHIWVAINLHAQRIIGYTHRWQQAYELTSKNGQQFHTYKYSDFCMASVDTEELQTEAVKAGWRTFRSKLENEKLLTNEQICLNSTKKLQCEDCLLCCGNTIKAKNIVINAHGCNLETYKLNTGRVQ